MTGIISKKSEKTHHFRESMSKYLIIHHNVKIIERIAKQLEDTRKVDNKNYIVYCGKYENKEITLIATGMGACNTAMIVDQAISCGAEYVFKLGTFGALQDDIKIGDIFIPNGAIRSDGLTDAYAPVYFPAVPNAELFNLMTNKANEQGLKVNSGIVHSVNIYSPYYTDTFNSNKYSPEKYQAINTFGVEMECSTVFLCSYVKSAKSIAILVCNRDWQTQKNFMEGKKSNWDKHQSEKIKDESTQKSIDLIFDTIKGL